MIALLLGGGVSMFITLVFTPLFAALLRGLRLGQLVRKDTPTTHQVKRGTPSMGGLVFVTAAVVGYFSGVGLSGQTPTVPALLVIFMMVGLGFVGFLDDFLKVRFQNSTGLRSYWKLIGQIVIGAVFAFIAVTYRDEYGVTPASTAISAVRDLDLDFVVLFGAIGGTIAVIVWVCLITLSASNAVNLTDGLDGLAAGASVFAIGSYVLIGFWQFNQNCATLIDETLLAKCYTVSSPMDLATIAACIVGALIGFLWWNTSPARIFMGDSGSLALGGALAALAVLSRTELLLVVIGGLFLLVTGSVILQIGIWRASRRRIRIFRASPLHHHFEMKGWAEITIVVRFWLISGLFVAAGVGLFYLEWLSR